MMNASVRAAAIEHVRDGAPPRARGRSGTGDASERAVISRCPLQEDNDARATKSPVTGAAAGDRLRELVALAKEAPRSSAPHARTQDLDALVKAVEAWAAR